MSTKLTPEERDDIKTFVTEVISSTVQAAAPEIVKISTAIRDARLTAWAAMPLETGTIEAYDVPQGRDYRKQLWVSVYTKAFGNPSFVDGAPACANTAVAAFDEAFPK